MAESPSHSLDSGRNPDWARVEVKMTHHGGSFIQFLSEEQLNAPSIAALFQQTFRLDTLEHYRLQWRDEEGDWVFLDDASELPALLRRTAAHLRHRLHIQSCQPVETETCMGLIRHTTNIDDLTATYMRVQQLYRALSNVQVRLNTVRHLVIVTKLGDPNLVPLTRELTIWLLETFPHMSVHLNMDLQEESRFKPVDLAFRYLGRIQYWDNDISHRVHVDLVITMGGDGTVLYAANLFQQQVPVIVPFHLGSLGFLTVFRFDSYQRYLTPMLNNESVLVNLRMRVSCSVYKHTRGNGVAAPPSSAALSLSTHSDKPAVDGERSDTGCECTRQSSQERGQYTTESETLALEDTSTPEDHLATLHSAVAIADAHEDDRHNIWKFRHQKEPLQVCPGVRVHEFQVLNEVVIDRGANAGMIQVDLLADDRPFTTILADGLVIATSTGSTAYSLSANGSLVHPEKNSILVTPICPHTLTCRPMIIPGTKRLRISISSNSRSSAWASFDGRNRLELQRGESIAVTASQYPVITVSRENQSMDWFASLREVLNWNERKTQKPLPSPYLKPNHFVPNP